MKKLFVPHLGDESSWTIEALEEWYFVPYRKGMRSMGNNFLTKRNEYNLPSGVPSELVLRIDKIPSTIDFWLVLDKPSPSEPFGTLSFDKPDELLEVNQLDPKGRLNEGTTVSELMNQIVNNVEWIAIDPDELPEMMRDFYQ